MPLQEREQKVERLIGVLADNPLQRHMMVSALENNGAQVLVCCEPKNFFDQPKERIEKVVCWIVEIFNEEADVSEIMEALDDQQDVPVLIGLGQAPDKHELSYVSWQRRLLQKVEEHIGRIGEIETDISISRIAEDMRDTETLRMAGCDKKAIKSSAERAKVAREVWVLAASLGGPAAVKSFIDQLPLDLGIGFLYAQHVDAHFSAVLTDVLGRHSALDLVPMRHNAPILENEIQVVPVDRQVTFNETSVQFVEQPWPGPYGPSIDQLLANLLEHYGARCNVIVFSGMGNDGALTIPAMVEKGCRVWTQTPDSCASASMPQSVIDLQCSQLIDTPENLARALIASYRSKSFGQSAH